MNVVSRAEWGAAPATGTSTIALPVPRLWLHHTASKADSGVRTVRAIQRYHQVSKDWNDVGYTWLYSPSTREFYEGRGPGVAGAHTKNDNTRSHALCVLGHFDVQDVPPHVVDDLRAFLRWHSRYGPQRFTGGHRDAPGAFTSCPGRNLYRLIPTINSIEEVDDMTDDDRKLLRSIDSRVRDVDARLQTVERRIGSRNDDKSTVLHDLGLLRKGLRKSLDEDGVEVEHPVEDGPAQL